MNRAWTCDPPLLLLRGQDWCAPSSGHALQPVLQGPTLPTQGQVPPDLLGCSARYRRDSTSEDSGMNMDKGWTDMGEARCPGGNHANVSGQVCCDTCWRRVPARLPGESEPWRTALHNARAIRAWGRIEDILVPVRDWLTDHQDV
jgi:hypothetical protein